MERTPLFRRVSTVVSSNIPELSFRARRILYSVVTEYIATGEPVGSRKLSKRYEIALSPASIRNVLADLEDAGFLAQPHTSAGRIPTDLGFRVFVDALVQMREVSSEDKAAIVAQLGNSGQGRDAIMRETARLLSSLTGTAAVLSAPRAENERLSQIRFVPMQGKQVLAVLVTKSGAVQNRSVEIGEPIDAGELERLHNYLNDLVDNRTLAEIREALLEQMEDERSDYNQLRRRAHGIIKATLTESGTGSPSSTPVLIEGQGVLFNRPEFSDPEKIRAFVRTFEEKERLIGLLDDTLKAGGVRVLIGSETHLDDVTDISVISAKYEHHTGASGSVGLVGPARVDYAKLVPLVEFTARTMALALDGASDGEDGGSGGDQE